MSIPHSYLSPHTLCPSSFSSYINFMHLSTVFPVNLYCCLFITFLYSCGLHPLLSSFPFFYSRLTDFFDHFAQKTGGFLNKNHPQMLINKGFAIDQLFSVSCRFPSFLLSAQCIQNPYCFLPLLRPKVPFLTIPENRSF